MSTHQRWFDDLTDQASRKSAAERADLPVSTLNFQYKRGEFSADVVVALARAYGVSPIVALARTGFITPDEVVKGGASEALQLASDMDLLAEVGRRIKASRAVWDMPLDKALSLPEQDPDYFERVAETGPEDDTEP
ncbi:helix-turn-helix domain-containing protein [Corynebacterium sphenisci]|uniref:helix-turn-helix domain-containing protein n=1 Tax=Corynebacterium sphenisci TaxID=191493 RepID=UPI000952A0E9|nr:helix-turn-helix transcriptional regulator [Corynebacterium sphenisci]